MGLVGLQFLAVSGRGLFGKRDHMVVRRQQIVEFDFEGTVGQLHEFAKKSEHFFVSGVGPGNLVAAADVPADLRSKQLGNRLQVSLGKGLVSAAD